MLNLKTRFFCIIALTLTLITGSQPAAANELSVVIWPKTNATEIDYANHLKLVQENFGPNPTLIMVWGWQRLEPDQGKLDPSREDGALRYGMGMGYRPYVGATVIDTTHRVLPADLAKLNWSDPKLLARYEAMLDALSTRLPADLPYFVIANEADMYLDKNPSEVTDFLTFMAQARLAVKKRFPAALVGASVTFDGLKRGGEREKIVRAIVNNSDAAFFTYYPVIDMKPSDPSEIPEHFRAIAATAGNKPIILQEVGYPSDTKETNRSMQAEFLSAVVPAVKNTPQIRLAAFFALHDFDEKMCEGLLGYYSIHALAARLTGFRAYLCTLGLFDENGKEKPAWQAILAAKNTVTENTENGGR